MWSYPGSERKKQCPDAHFTRTQTHRSLFVEIGTDSSGFPARLLKKAYSVDFKSSFTDDASVAEEYGIEIHLVEGNDENIKITTAFDFNLAEILVNSILQ